MRERPILFSGPMVHAILEGRKTQTRRPVKFQPGRHSNGVWSFCVSSTDKSDRDTWSYRYPDANGDTYSIRGKEKVVARQRCPFGHPGDRLWVRESFQYCFAGAASENHPRRFSRKEKDIYPFGPCDDRFFHLEYAATPPERVGWEGGWKPSIHMPRWASRISLEITNVRVERLQEISEEDAQAEGAEAYDPTAYFTAGQMGGRNNLHKWEYRAGFAELWNSVYGNWKDNTWVWAVEFKRLEATNA